MLYGRRDFGHEGRYSRHATANCSRTGARQSVGQELYYRDALICFPENIIHARWKDDSAAGSVPAAFQLFAKGKPEWNDVLALLASPLGKTFVRTSNASSPSHKPTRQPQRAPSQNRLTYGNPIDFRGLRHEPVNEQGVVLLFGMLAKQLGYLVESVQMGFPDCEAKRQIGPERWQRVNIEFEFESRNFRDHGHPLTGCDVIVCWRHNWPECPKNIEVVELSKVIKSLAGAAD